jgi:hypothetical protein
MSGMIKKMLCIATIGAGVSLAYLASATAPDDGEPPPPPPTLNECSPGFWKNHPEYWATQYCGSEQCVADVLEELTSKGPGSDARRHDQASDLNTWADGYYKMQICTE